MIRFRDRLPRAWQDPDAWLTALVVGATVLYYAGLLYAAYLVGYVIRHFVVKYW